MNKRDLDERWGGICPGFLFGGQSFVTIKPKRLSNQSTPEESVVPVAPKLSRRQRKEQRRRNRQSRRDVTFRKQKLKVEEGYVE